MQQLTDVLRERTADAAATLREAQRLGDDYLAEVTLGELEELRRVATSHRVTIRGLNDVAA